MSTWNPGLNVILPAGWREIRRTSDGVHMEHGASRRSVIVSVAVEEDARRWLHLSVAHPERMPTWEDLVDVKELFIGRRAYAFQVIPPRSRYVNLHPFCLHLFHCLDEPMPLPDFTRGSGSL